MNTERLFNLVLGTLLMARAEVRKPRDERGLSQSTENVILLVGAVTVALIITGLVTKYVNDYLQLTPP